MNRPRFGVPQGTNTLDDALDQVLAILDERLRASSLVRVVVDFDAEHICIVTDADERRLRIYSVERLLRELPNEHIPAPATPPGDDLLEAASLALASIAVLRHTSIPSRLHQACIDLERRSTIHRLADGRIRTLELEVHAHRGRPRR